MSLSASQPTTSYHRRQLVDASLVNVKKRRRWVYYELNSNGFDQLITMLERVKQVATAEVA